MKKIYNLMFPIWFLFLLPSYFWIVILIINFIIDSIVLYLAFNKLNINFKENYLKHIIKVWIIGFISDFIGALFLFLLILLFDKLNITINISRFPWATILAIPGVFISGMMIYHLNRLISFNNSFNEDEIKLICKYLVIYTTPYLMLIPLYF